MTGAELKTGIRAALKIPEKVPDNKFVNMLVRTFIGAVFLFAAGYFGGYKEIFPWYISGAFTVIGATTWSTQVVVGVIKALIEPFRAVMQIVRNEKPEPEEEPNDG
jgi:hypothetical protein